MERRIFLQLPVEIIEEILYKLPVKSLLRFKCVSKSWCSSISSRGFIKEHLNKSNTGTDFAHHNLIFRLRHQPNPVIVGSDYLPLESFFNLRSVGSCCIGSLLSDNNDDYDPNHSCFRSNQFIPIPAFEDSDGYYLGSCNGLILIQINTKKLYLWNPSTRKTKNILNASFPKETTSWRGWYDSGCGLGYNELTDDYKVICTFYGCSQPEEQMLMYSSRTDSWKTILNFNEGYLVDGPAEFVNGRLYWLGLEEYVEAGDRWNIVSLDLVEEEDKYQIIAPPPGCAYSYEDRF